MAGVVKIQDLVLGDVVSFQMYGASQTPVVNGVLIAKVSGQGLTFPQQASIGHANMFPAIPDATGNVPDNYTLYDYLQIRKEVTPGNFVIREIGIPWIIPVSVTRQFRQTATVTIQDFDSNQLGLLKKILNINGFNLYTVSVSTPT